MLLEEGGEHFIAESVLLHPTLYLGGLQGEPLGQGGVGQVALQEQVETGQEQEVRVVETGGEFHEEEVGPEEELFEVVGRA